MIPVDINWLQSGINTSNLPRTDEIHRVSLRFFPADGSTAFDRYLEGNVIEGEIAVPVGRYSVVAFNESIYDLDWWQGVTFTDVDSYGGFAANVDPDAAANYRFYTPVAGQQLVAEPQPLASWSLGDFEVTEQMAYAQHGSGSLSPREQTMLDALTHIVMRRLTFTVNIVADVQNLGSAQDVYATAGGFARRIYMASGEVEPSPCAHICQLGARQYDGPDMRDGTARRSFLSFGRLLAPGSAAQDSGAPGSAAESYSLGLTIYTVDGALYAPPSPLQWDVTDQVTAGPGPDINIYVRFSLPYVEGEVKVTDWDDEDIIIQ